MIPFLPHALLLQPQPVPVPQEIPLFATPIEIHRPAPHSASRQTIDRLSRLTAVTSVFKSPFEHLSNAGIAAMFRPIADEASFLQVPQPLKGHQGARKVLNLTPLFGPEGPRPEDVQQGNAGDCFLLSVLAALAEHKPEVLINLLHPMDATGMDYLVEHCDPRTDEMAFLHVFDTSWVDEQGQALYAGDGTNPQSVPQSAGSSDDRFFKGISWVRVLENFLAIANERYGLINYKTGFSGLNNGGRPATVYRLLTGDLMDHASPVPPESVFREVLKSTNQGDIVILGSRPLFHKDLEWASALKLNDEQRSSMQQTIHAYAVLGIADNEVELYNPWGYRLTVEFDEVFRHSVEVLASP